MNKLRNLNWFTIACILVGLAICGLSFSYGDPDLLPIKDNQTPGFLLALGGTITITPLLVAIADWKPKELC